MTTDSVTPGRALLFPSLCLYNGLFCAWVGKLMQLAALRRRKKEKRALGVARGQPLRLACRLYSGLPPFVPTRTCLPPGATQGYSTASHPFRTTYIALALAAWFSCSTQNQRRRERQEGKERRREEEGKEERKERRERKKKEEKTLPWDRRRANHMVTVAANATNSR